MNRRVSALRRSDARGDNSVLNDDSDIDWATSTRRDSQWWRRLGNDSGSRFFPTNTRHTKVDDTVVVEESYISFKLQEVYELSEDEENFSMESLSDISRASDRFVKPRGLFRANAKKTPRSSLANLPALPPPTAEISNLPRIQISQESTSHGQDDDHLNDRSVNKSLSFHNNSSLGSGRPKSFFKSNASIKKVNFDDVMNDSKVSTNISDFDLDISNPIQDISVNKPKKSLFKSSNTKRGSKLFADAVSFSESNHSERFDDELISENPQNTSNKIMNTSSSQKILGEKIMNRTLDQLDTSRRKSYNDVKSNDGINVYEEVDDIMRPSKNIMDISNNITLETNYTLDYKSDVDVPKKSLFKSSNNQRKTNLFAAAISFGESERSGLNNESRNEMNRMDGSATNDARNVSYDKPMDDVNVDEDRAVNDNEEVEDDVTSSTHIVNNMSTTKNTTFFSLHDDSILKPKKSLFNLNRRQRKSNNMFAAAISFSESNKSQSSDEELEMSASKRIKLSSPKSVANNDTVPGGVDDSQDERIAEASSTSVVSQSITLHNTLMNRVSLLDEPERLPKTLFKSSKTQERKSNLFAGAISLTSDSFDESEENVSTKQSTSSQEMKGDSLRINDEDVVSLLSVTEEQADAVIGDQVQEMPNAVEIGESVGADANPSEQGIKPFDVSLKQDKSDRSFTKEKPKLNEGDGSEQVDVTVKDKAIAKETVNKSKIQDKLIAGETLNKSKTQDEEMLNKSQDKAIANENVNKSETQQNTSSTVNNKLVVKETLNQSKSQDVTQAEEPTVNLVTDKSVGEEILTQNKSVVRENVPEQITVVEQLSADKSVKKDKSFAKDVSLLSEDDTSKQTDITLKDKSVDKEMLNKSKTRDGASKQANSPVNETLNKSKTRRSASDFADKSLKDETTTKETVNKSKTQDVTSKQANSPVSDRSVAKETLNKSKSRRSGSQLTEKISSESPSKETLNKSKTQDKTIGNETLNASKTQQIKSSKVNDSSLVKETLSISSHRSASDLADKTSSEKSPSKEMLNKSKTRGNETLNISKTQQNTSSPVKNISFTKETLNKSKNRRSPSDLADKTSSEKSPSKEMLSKSKNRELTLVDMGSPVNDKALPKETVNESQTQDKNVVNKTLNKLKSSDRKEQTVSPVNNKSVSKETLNKTTSEVSTSVDKTGTQDRTLRNKSKTQNSSINKSVTNETVTLTNNRYSGEKIQQENIIQVVESIQEQNNIMSAEQIDREVNSSAVKETVEDLPAVQKSIAQDSKALNKSVSRGDAMSAEEVTTPYRSLRNRSVLNSSKTVRKSSSPLNSKSLSKTKLSNTTDDVENESTTEQSTMQDSYKDLGIVGRRSEVQNNVTNGSQAEINADKSNIRNNEQSSVASDMNSAVIDEKSHSYNTLFNASSRRNNSTQNENMTQSETTRKSQSYTMFHVSKLNQQSNTYDEVPSQHSDSNNDTSEVTQGDSEDVRTAESERRNVDTIEEEETIVSEDDESEGDSESDDSSVDNSGDNIVLNMSDHDNMRDDASISYEDPSQVDDEPSVVVRRRAPMELYSTFKPERPARKITDPAEKERRISEYKQQVSKYTERIRKEAEEEVAKLFNMSVPQLRPFLMGNPQEMITAADHNKTSEHIIETKTSKKFLAEACGKVMGATVKNSKVKRRLSGRMTKRDGVKKNKLYMKELWITRRLYNFIQNKLKAKYGLMSTKQSETFVKFLANVVNSVEKCDGSDAYPSVEELKVHMASMNIISTHRDFVTFVDDYLPHTFRIKSIPAVGRDVPRIRGKLDDLILNKK